MNIHHVPTTPEVKQSRGQRRTRALNELDAAAVAKHLVTFTPQGGTIADLLAIARHEIRELADLSAVQRVASHNPDSIWAIARRNRYSANEPCAGGFIAFLFLNEAGADALFNGSLNRSDPDLSLLCRQHEKPAAIYIWHLHARGTLAPGVALAFQKISTPQYKDVDIWTRPITGDGSLFTDLLGFSQGVCWKQKRREDLYLFARSPETLSKLSPMFDSYRADNPDHLPSVAVSRTLDDFMKVTAVRTAVYIDEQRCPFSEEFDGNDFAGIHLLGYVGQEPAGCMRIRFFGEFAKCERMAVRKEFRKTRLADCLIKAAIELSRKKGFNRIYAHAQVRLERFWRRYGFEPLPGAPRFTFSDHDYVEMVMPLCKHLEPVCIGGDPFVSIRPEGRWNSPGILEHSSER